MFEIIVRDLTPKEDEELKSNEDSVFSVGCDSGCLIILVVFFLLSGHLRFLGNIWVFQLIIELGWWRYLIALGILIWIPVFLFIKRYRRKENDIKVQNLLSKETITYRVESNEALLLTSKSEPNRKAILVKLEESLTLVLSGDWLFERSTYFLNFKKARSWEFFNGLAPPHCFPNSSFELSVYPRTRSLKGIRCNGDYLTPEHNTIIEGDWPIRDGQWIVKAAMNDLTNRLHRSSELSQSEFIDLIDYSKTL